ncbi:MAG: hypothetical protein R3B90_05735 [Planctomycetaceae bacterium]
MSRYLRQFALCFAAYLASVAAMNLFVDPNGVFGLYESESFTRYKAQSLERIAKAEEANRGRADVLLLGDSRVMIGLDPRHPALTRHGRVENLAVAGGSLFEGWRMLESAMEVRPPKLVVWGIEPEAMRSLLRPRLDARARTCRIDPDLDLFGYYRKQLIGLPTTRESIRTVRRRLLHPEYAWADHGHKIDWKDHPPDAWRTNPEILTRRMEHGRKARRGMATGIQQFEPLLSRAQQAGVHIVLFIPPTHAMLQEATYRQVSRRQFSNDSLIALTATVEQLNRAAPDRPAIELWDFTGFTEYHTEPFPTVRGDNSQRWHWDAIHFQSSLGNLVLNRMLDRAAEPAELGARMTSDSLPMHLVDWARQHRVYHRGQPAQIEQVAELNRAAERMH